MDEIKKSVIKILKEDARITPSAIAVMLGKEEKEITKAIKELENGGVIAKYTAVINTEKTGEDFVDALIEVKVTPQARSGFDSIAQEICRYDEVKAVYLMSGTFDLAIMLQSKTMRDISLFVSERLARIESVVSTATHFIMKQYKEGGVALFDGNNNFRMPVHE
ncbi:MAG: Lrp/AsnC family transcriptional regulator [Clostridiales bacterium]|jgi:DNA-binding Lrp family transcriptional regulator|nr:Lrp/AsnC family transcriptional regulator [Clostridiales bacterium]MDY4655276.1 Lrp/AsnC family transcriptional regulator [Eubacteriales bacterium]